MPAVTGFTSKQLADALLALYRAEERVTTAFDALDDARQALKAAQDAYACAMAYPEGGDRG